MNRAFGQDVIDRLSRPGHFPGKADLPVDAAISGRMDIAPGLHIGEAVQFGIGGPDIGLQRPQGVLAGGQLHQAEPLAHFRDAGTGGLVGGFGLVQAGLADMALSKEVLRAFQSLGGIAGGGLRLDQLVPCRCNLRRTGASLASAARTAASSCLSSKRKRSAPSAMLSPSTARVSRIRPAVSGAIVMKSPSA